MTVYPDNSATSKPKPYAVCAAIVEYMPRNGASLGKGITRRRGVDIYFR
jgi:hypothetical protein